MAGKLVYSVVWQGFDLAPQTVERIKADIFATSNRPRPAMLKHNPAQSLEEALADAFDALLFTSTHHRRDGSRVVKDRWLRYTHRPITEHELDALGVYRYRLKNGNLRPIGNSPRLIPIHAARLPTDIEQEPEPAARPLALTG
ncbi:MAG: hypothetical protein WAJ85_10125 [Candidatus Baltobacteraceae bacterium]